MAFRLIQSARFSARAPLVAQAGRFTRGLLAVAAVVAASCGQVDGPEPVVIELPEQRQPLCGDGELFETDDGDFCLFEREQMEQAECPEGFPIIHQFGELHICGFEPTYALLRLSDRCEAIGDDAVVCGSTAGCFHVAADRHAVVRDNACQTVDTGLCVLIPRAVNNGVATCNYRAIPGGEEAFIWGTDERAFGWQNDFDLLGACACVD